MESFFYLKKKSKTKINASFFLKYVFIQVGLFSKIKVNSCLILLMEIYLNHNPMEVD